MSADGCIRSKENTRGEKQLLLHVNAKYVINDHGLVGDERHCVQPRATTASVLLMQLLLLLPEPIDAMPNDERDGHNNNPRNACPGVWLVEPCFVWFEY